MADVEVNIKVQNGDAVKSMRQLQQELKSLVSQQQSVTQGSAEWKKLAKAINEAEGKIGDLTDSFKTLKGSGVERVSSSFDLLKEGFANFDTDKIKIGFKGIGSAMSAIPLLLIVQGITVLAEKFDIFGKITEVITEAVFAFTDALGITNHAAEQASKKLIEDKKKEQEVIEARYDSEIAFAKAAKKDTTELEKNKNEAMMKSTLIQMDSLLELQERKKKLNKEEQEQFDALQKDLTKLSTERHLIELKQIEERKEASKEYNRVVKDIQEEAILLGLSDSEKAIRKLKQNQEEITKQLDEQLNKRGALTSDAYERDAKIRKTLEENTQKEINKIIAEDNKNFAEEKKKKNLVALQEELYRLGLEEQKQQGELNKLINEGIEVDNENKLAILNDFVTQQTAIKQKANEDENLSDEQLAYLKKKRREEELADIKSGLDNSAQGIVALGALSETYFAIKRANTKKGSAEDEAAARKQFQINKAMQLGTAAINGAQSVLAITSVPDFTLGIASAIRIAAQVALTAKTIATIAATQFQPSGGGGSAPSFNAPNINTGGGNTPNPNQIPQQKQQSTTFDNQGNNTSEVVVRVSEINDTQKKVARIKEQVKF